MSGLVPMAAPPIVVGPIAVQGEWIVGPQGSVHGRGARIELVNRTVRRRAIPTWAIVLAIMGFFILTFFSLFFLLASEERLEGAIIVRGIGADSRVVEGAVPVTGANFEWAWSDLAARANAANLQLARL